MLLVAQRVVALGRQQLEGSRRDQWCAGKITSWGADCKHAFRLCKTTNLFVFVEHACVCTQSRLTLCEPMDCSPPGSSVHGISEERVLVWVAISFSKDSAVFSSALG